eukprot:GILI01014031.1.p1 GENE.GILI01014031.1~~GILI01014031.1.p1  ORF type:complete len:765 (-),score=51.82 GILI01014031.1:78-2372(-)
MSFQVGLEISKKLLAETDTAREILKLMNHADASKTLADYNGDVVKFHTQVKKAYIDATGLTEESMLALQKAYGKKKEVSQVEQWAKHSALASANKWYHKYLRAEQKNEALTAIFSRNKQAWIKSAREAFSSLAKDHKLSMNIAFWVNLLLPKSDGGTCGIDEDTAVFLIDALVHDHRRPDTLFVESNWRSTTLLGETEGHQYRVMYGDAIERMAALLYRIRGECDWLNRDMIREVENQFHEGSGAYHIKPNKCFNVTVENVGGYSVQVTDGVVDLTEVQSMMTKIQNDIQQDKDNLCGQIKFALQAVDNMKDQVRVLKQQEATLINNNRVLQGKFDALVKQTPTYISTVSSEKTSQKMGSTATGGAAVAKSSESKPKDVICISSPSKPVEHVAGGDFFQCVDSNEIDAVFQAMGVNALSSMFGPIMREDMAEAEALLRRSLSDLPLVIPFNSSYHWICVLVKKGVMFVADSAPSPATVNDLNTLHALLQKVFNRKVTRENIPVARQPYGSNECGVHLILNSLIMVRGPMRGAKTCTVSYGVLREILKRVAEGKLNGMVLPSCAYYVAALQKVELCAQITRDEILQLVDTMSGQGHKIFVSTGWRDGELVSQKATIIERARSRWAALDRNGNRIAIPGATISYIGILDVETDEYIAANFHAPAPQQHPEVRQEQLPTTELPPPPPPPHKSTLSTPRCTLHLLCTTTRTEQIIATLLFLFILFFHFYLYCFYTCHTCTNSVAVCAQSPRCPSQPLRKQFMWGRENK